MTYQYLNLSYSLLVKTGPSCQKQWANSKRPWLNWHKSDLRVTVKYSFPRRNFVGSFGLSKYYSCDSWYNILAGRWLFCDHWMIIIWLNSVICLFPWHGCPSLVWCHWQGCCITKYAANIYTKIWFNFILLLKNNACTHIIFIDMHIDKISI